MKVKGTLFDVKGTKKSEIDMPEFFSKTIREDLVAKYTEVEKLSEMHNYSSYKEAGKRHSASGTISHRRHKWKGAYGKGISRVPRKKMRRRGTQFFWVAAEVSNTRGGRRAHPPLGLRAPGKINKKEMQNAFAIAFAATANKKEILKRYASLEDIKTVPVVIESLPQKTKDLKLALNLIFEGSSNIVFKTKKVRAGKGKLRGRKYKSSAGLLIITSNSEENKFKGVDVKSVNELSISDLYPLGRLTLYTQKALEELKYVA
ncbi:50S ribosomal protein L4 [Candidatus Pacearchaeota archaeon CG10_big_fil_rev_8_21_14_0_10_31_24]|nr:MAG: 50S ribosomal protein L4 [Candidatus Pacearchaeota archaeon CG10_big_fil_rev_8_21_14_0_10_31_24]